MLILKEKISEGGVRECYFHPQDREKCVKVMKNSKDVGLLHRELQVFNKVREQLAPFLCHYDRELVKTDKGYGLVMEVVYDDDGSVSQRLSTFLESQEINENLKKQFDEFFSILLDNKFYFTDFNLHNFLIVQKKEGQEIKYTDLKSYKATKSIIKLEVIFPFLWRSKTIRRMNRLYGRIGL